MSKAISNKTVERDLIVLDGAAIIVRDAKGKKWGEIKGKLTMTRETKANGDAVWCATVSPIAEITVPVNMDMKKPAEIARILRAMKEAKQ